MKRRLGSRIERRPDAGDTDSTQFIYILCATVFRGLLFGSVFPDLGGLLAVRL